MERNTAERDLETETDPRTEYKRVGKLGRFLTKNINRDMPTTWRSAHGDCVKKTRFGLTDNKDTSQLQLKLTDNKDTSQLQLKLTDNKNTSQLQLKGFLLKCLVPVIYRTKKNEFREWRWAALDYRCPNSPVAQCSFFAESRQHFFRSFIAETQILCS